MENPHKLILIISILTLLAVGFSYFKIMGAIEQQPQGELQAAKRTTIVVSGEGDTITRTSGSGNCNPTSPNIMAEASIVGGVNGNKIKATAKCALSNWSATATATDTGGAAVFARGLAPAGQGAASCTPTYTSAGAPDSAWTISCTF
ncbi:hypothetical protein EYS14_09205 [Alteromonadaceae bacterium M269]|nr:hypothetical protein EYS14_09205 [Alteromonadaceae bacterium M269]